MAISQLDFSIALIMGLGPGLGVMYWSIRRFDIPFTQYRLFDDRRLFGGFAIGMIFGAIAGFVEQLPVGDVVGVLLAFPAFVVFEESFKMVWLNRKPYRGRFDTTFYGVSVGVGVGGILAVANILHYVAAVGSAYYTPENVALFLLFSIGFNLVHVDTGALIGFGASRGEMMWPFIKAVLIRLGATVVLLAFSLPDVGEPWPAVSVVTAIVFAAIIYHYVYTVLLPGTLPEDIRREMRREKRRARKAKA